MLLLLLLPLEHLLPLVRLILSSITVTFTTVSATATIMKITTTYARALEMQVIDSASYGGRIDHHAVKSIGL